MAWVQIALFLVLLTAAYAGHSSAPWVPTRKKERALLLQHLPREATDVIVDLGAGTGTLLFALARADHTGPLIGYEISLGPYLFSLLRKWLHPRRYRMVRLRYCSLWRADLTNATTVLCFLLPSSYSRLTPWLRATACPGTTIVVHGWPLPDWPHSVMRADRTLPWYLHKVQ